MSHEIEDSAVAIESRAEKAELTVEPVAIVAGSPLLKMPEDLYIPPEALRVFLETFQGPLDLLLYLIRKNNLDILDIPIAKITEQYMQYVELMKHVQLELAGDYLVMAAMLAEIKSRMLLPRPVSEFTDEEDPRAELVRRLQEYERFKIAAESIDILPRLERDVFVARTAPPEMDAVVVEAEVALEEILLAFRDIVRRLDLNASHVISKEPLSIRERMTIVLDKIKKDAFIDFVSLFTVSEGRMGVVVTLIALLELLKQHMIEVVQTQEFGTIHIKAKTS